MARRSHIALFAVVTLVLLVGLAPRSAVAEPFCADGEVPRFLNGFADLRATVGEQMGDPVECEHGFGADGSTTQRTTTGVAVYDQGSTTLSFARTETGERWTLTGTGLDYSNTPPSPTPTQTSAPAVPVASPTPAPRVPSHPWSHGRLRVSANGHYLVHDDGTPFFWLADTAWDLFNRLSREDAATYLEDRRQKGFTVVQAVAMPVLDPLDSKNAYGRSALHGTDPLQPDTTPGSDPTDRTQYDYWDHLDFVIRLAAEKNLYVAMLPTWGDKVNKAWGIGPEIFNATTARSYGRWLGDRLHNEPNIIWVLGGDRDPTERQDVWRAMAEGIQEGTGGDPLMTYHPMGEKSSSSGFQADGWLDFNMVQSGHYGRDLPVWNQIGREYALTPPKPVVDAESNYEDHPVGWNESYGRFTDHDIRKQAYRAVFAGALGQTYGDNTVWQFFEPGRQGWTGARQDWRVALNAPGAAQMVYLRKLMESRPFISGVPDQALIVNGQGPDNATHAQATRGSEGSYAMAYVPSGGRIISLDTSKLTGSELRAWLYDPRNGGAQEIGTFSKGQAQPIQVPSDGPDWIVVLDDASRGFPPPGQVDLSQPPG